MQSIFDYKKILLIENQYFPCVKWIKILFLHSHIIISPFDGYRKMSFRNRCMVAGSNGLVPLSVPVENGRNQKVPFKDVRICYREDWQKNHWRTIVSCYSKSAFFEYYGDAVEKFFLEKEVFLFDLDIKIILWLRDVLKIDCNFDISANVSMSAEIGVADLRDRWLPKNFQQENEASSLPKYFQVFENRIGFQPNLSILDMLFNEGPNTAAMLKS